MNYESSAGELPVADVREHYPGTDQVKTYHSWVTLLMNYIEQGAVWNSTDWVKKTLEERNDEKDKTHHIKLPSFDCPSDIEVGVGVDWYGARGNYAVNAGRGFMWADDPDWRQEIHPKDSSDFDLLPLSSLEDYGSFFVNRALKLRDVTDGTTNTAAASELRKMEGEDTRGSLHFGACVMYMHDATPNSFKEDKTRYCDRRAAANIAPCRPTTEGWKGEWVHYARSTHPGGVNVMMLDTSVRFISDDVSLTTWHQVSTPFGDEVVEGPL
jgi:prepilin-type processing-associated H-X9-DG protein